MKHQTTPQMVFCLLPNRKADTYAAVKKLCCLQETPIASQCLLVSTIRADDKVVAVATKVAIQMNCKLGGEPWMIQQKAANTMVIGIDTYHDTGEKFYFFMAKTQDFWAHFWANFGPELRNLAYKKQKNPRFMRYPSLTF